MKTRRVMVSGLKDDLRVSSTCPETENKRSTGHEVEKNDDRSGRSGGSDVREISTKIRNYPQNRWGWCVSHVVCI
jgi:hypothetical protein